MRESSLSDCGFGGYSAVGESKYSATEYTQQIINSSKRCLFSCSFSFNWANRMVSRVECVCGWMMWCDGDGDDDDEDDAAIYFESTHTRAHSHTYTILEHNLFVFFPLERRIVNSCSLISIYQCHVMQVLVWIHCVATQCLRWNLRAVWIIW